MLDIGCGRGYLLTELRNRGWEVVGTELSDETASYARHVRGIDVRVGPLDEIDFGQPFDAVVMWHALEHFPDPDLVLGFVKRALRLGGTLLLGVPNFASWEAGIFREHWFSLDVPRHLVHLAEGSLRPILSRHGLAIDDIGYYSAEYDHFSFAQSALNRLGLPFNGLFHGLRARSAASGFPVPSKAARLLAMLMAAPFTLLSLPWTVAGALAHRGASLTIFCTRTEVDAATGSASEETGAESHAVGAVTSQGDEGVDPI
ncbi:MAG: hypothetical protein QOE92_2572 [Chloroflexota bacterium]|nr:hypothetical protein [Chloroflexota bacterium]